MVTAAIKEQILSDLDRLSPEQQRQGTDFARTLASPLPRGASVEDLTIAGTLDDESARQMREAIEEGCEKVDLTCPTSSPGIGS